MGSEMKKTLFAAYCRVWPEYVRFARGRKVRNTIFIALGFMGVFPLLKLVPFHVFLLWLFLFNTVPFLLAVFPLLLIWGVTTWPWKGSFYKKVLLAPAEEGEHGTLKERLWVEHTDLLFWQDGKVSLKEHVEESRSALIS